MTAADLYVIWSFEHDGWWRAHRMGYTSQFTEAGHYTKAEAHGIVREANAYVKTPHEWVFRLDRAAILVAKGWHPLTPGTYDDGQGGLHLVLDEMLIGHGYADTPANRQMLIDAAREQAGDAVQVEE
jgi:hypothetical protein